MPGKCVRGAILDINLDPAVGHEVRKSRPCLVVQNDIGNRFSPLTIVVPVSGAEHVAKPYPIHVLIPKGEAGLAKDSVAMCNQIRCVDETRFGKTRGHVSPRTMAKVDQALKISLGLK
jgi:mRNA interferase MazF